MPVAPATTYLWRMSDITVPIHWHLSHILTPIFPPFPPRVVVCYVRACSITCILNAQTARKGAQAATQPNAPMVPLFEVTNETPDFCTSNKLGVLGSHPVALRASPRVSFS